MIASFMPGLQLYQKRMWEKATQAFKNHVVFFPEDAVGKIYLDRCRAYLAAPPAEDWDGVHQMETK
jgi:hypothetical protein